MADPVRQMIRFAKAVKDMDERLGVIEDKLDQVLEYMQPIEDISDELEMSVVEEGAPRRGRPRKGQ